MMSALPARKTTVPNAVSAAPGATTRQGSLRPSSSEGETTQTSEAEDRAASASTEIASRVLCPMSLRVIATMVWAEANRTSQ